MPRRRNTVSFDRAGPRGMREAVGVLLESGRVRVDPCPWCGAAHVVERPGRRNAVRYCRNGFGMPFIVVIGPD